MGASRAMDANLQGVFIALIVIAFVFAIAMAGHYLR
jgi:hypothetical protein